MNSSVARRKITSVANLVQRVSLRGNGRPEMASRTELLPLDWSPQTINCGRAVYSLSPSARRASITSRSLICSRVCKCSSFAESVTTTIFQLCIYRLVLVNGRDLIGDLDRSIEDSLDVA